MIMIDSAGVYAADRASALTGVPKSTVYYWAREGHVPPSASSQGPKLWSFQDLLALRAVYWLRQPKNIVGDDEKSQVVFSEVPAKNPDIPRTAMSAVRLALDRLRELDLELIAVDPDAEGGLRPTLVVNRNGTVLVHPPGEYPYGLDGQRTHDELIDLLAPWRTVEGTYGPDLLRPRPLLRIVPKKLGGSPHVAGTRVETLSLDSLRRSGYSEDGIAKLYPFVAKQAVRESVDLEEQLRRNLAPRRAAA